MGSQPNRGGRQVDKDSKYYVVGSGQEGSLETVQTWRWGSGQPGVSINFLGEHRRPELNVKLYEVQKISRGRSGQGGMVEGTSQREHRCCRVQGGECDRLRM